MSVSRNPWDEIEWNEDMEGFVDNQKATTL
jgi:hypothetical protein